MEGTGDLLLNFLLANVVWQLLVVIGQNKKAPWRVLFRETLYVITCAKVGVDVYRVASGAKRETFQSISADTELGECLLQKETIFSLPFTSHTLTYRRCRALSCSCFISGSCDKDWRDGV